MQQWMLLSGSFFSLVSASPSNKVNSAMVTLYYRELYT
jgi:hypothetical protein